MISHITLLLLMKEVCGGVLEAVAGQLTVSTTKRLGTCCKVVTALKPKCCSPHANVPVQTCFHPEEYSLVGSPSLVNAQGKQGSRYRRFCSSQQGVPATSTIPYLCNSSLYVSEAQPVTAFCFRDSTRLVEVFL